MECPLCKTELEVTFDYGGLVVQCPVCSDYFKILRSRSAAVSEAELREKRCLRGVRL